MVTARTSPCGGGRGAGNGRRGRARGGRGGRGSTQARLVNTCGYLFYLDGMRTCRQLTNIQIFKWYPDVLDPSSNFCILRILWWSFGGNPLIKNKCKPFWRKIHFVNIYMLKCGECKKILFPISAWTIPDYTWKLFQMIALKLPGNLFVLPVGAWEPLAFTLSPPGASWCQAFLEGIVCGHCCKFYHLENGVTGPTWDCR